MQDRQSPSIKGINSKGEKREYVFNLMDAETGTRIFHQYAGVMVQVHDRFVDFVVKLAQSKDGGLTQDEEIAYNLLGTDENVMYVIKQLPTIFTWEVTAGLAKEMLAGHKVKMDGKEYTADENGFIAESAGDPLEMYTALLYAVEANYPSYITPLKQNMVSLFQDDSTQDSESKKSETAKSESPEK